jgi:hypothetical protein
MMKTQAKPRTRYKVKSTRLSPQQQLEAEISRLMLRADRLVDKLDRMTVART